MRKGGKEEWVRRRRNKETINSPNVCVCSSPLPSLLSLPPPSPLPSFLPPSLPPSLPLSSSLPLSPSLPPPSPPSPPTHTVCGLNVHKRCERVVPHNCGINQKQLSDVLKEMGVTADKLRPKPSVGHRSPNVNIRFAM